MREIVFDTETTGLDSRVERVIEIGAIELVNRFPTGRTYHVYINPDGRPIDPEAQAVHGISMADLADKPVFGGIVDEFCAFIDGATLVAHNAGFDIGFLNAEFARTAGRRSIRRASSIRWPLRAASIRWARIRSMRSAVGMASTTAIEPATARCSILVFWPRSISS